MPNLLFFLLSLGVTLRLSYSSSDGVSAGPTTISTRARSPTGQLVVVVQNDPTQNLKSLHPAPLARPLALALSESNRIDKRASRKNVVVPVPAGINRQGLLLAKPSVNESPLLRGKSRIAKFIQASPRHLNAIPKNGATISNKAGIPLTDKVNNPRLINFRPHQPDIGQNAGNGNLPVSIGFPDDTVTGLRQLSPSLMENKFNPFTNGASSNFPPGIDPFEGTIRYAGENLDSPARNVIDYHSSEQFYSSQQALSPHHQNINSVGKEISSIENHPYADSFGYPDGGGNNGGGENRHSPLLPGPPVGTAVTVEGFRARDNPEGHDPADGLGNSGHNSLAPYEHGIDHFLAPSPGLGSASPPSLPRPPTTDSASYEEDLGHRASPYESTGPSPFGMPPLDDPFKNSGEPGASPNNGPPPPPDLGVFQEGPPPELTGNSRGPSPGLSPLPNGASANYRPRPLNGGGPDKQNMPVNDGGDDAIWGILDLAEMLEKGQLPNKGGNSPAAGNRKIYPIYPGASSQTDAASSPSHFPPKYPFQSSSDNNYDYDEGGAAAEGGNKMPQFGLESNEGNDEYDDTYSK